MPPSLAIRDGCHAARPAAETEDSTDDWLHLIRAEYLEMPGLHLTCRQAQRLWNLDADTCDALLNALVRAGFLRRTVQGAYIRADS